LPEITLARQRHYTTLPQTQLGVRIVFQHSQTLSTVKATPLYHDEDEEPFEFAAPKMSLTRGTLH